MKTPVFFLPFVIVMLASSSCTRSNNNLEPPAQNQTVTSGTCQVSLFTDSGKDETSIFPATIFALTPMVPSLPQQTMKQKMEPGTSTTARKSSLLT